MLCAYKARKSLSNYELVCYEKNESPGGEPESPAFTSPHGADFVDLRYMVSSGDRVPSLVWQSCWRSR